MDPFRQQPHALVAPHDRLAVRSFAGGLSDASAPFKPKHVPAKPSLTQPSHTGPLPPQEDEPAREDEVTTPAD